jgi:hypothetical protein
MAERKAYRDFTDEEKRIYKEKRNAWKAKKDDDAAASFDALEQELVKLKANKQVMEIFNRCKSATVKTGERSTGTTHMTTMFNTETPEPGTYVTYDYISLRGPNGERMNPDEDKKAFVMRMNGDVTWTKDARTINEMVWYTVRRGINLKIDKTAMTVTYVG